MDKPMRQGLSRSAETFFKAMVPLKNSAAMADHPSHPFHSYNSYKTALSYDLLYFCLPAGRFTEVCVIIIPHYWFVYLATTTYFFTHWEFFFFTPTSLSHIVYIISWMLLLVNSYHFSFPVSFCRWVCFREVFFFLFRSSGVHFSYFFLSS